MLDLGPRQCSYVGRLYRGQAERIQLIHTVIQVRMKKCEGAS